ncbi:MAG: hypothetical protein WEC80_02230, partial [Patescibacteria group bacterium]
LSHYIKKLTNILDVSEQSIFTLINRVRNKKNQKGFLSKKVEDDSKETRDIKIQKYVLSLIFQSKDPFNLSEKLFNTVGAEEFSTPSFKKIAENLISFNKQQKESFNIDKFSLRLKPELRPVFDELFLYATYEADFEVENVNKLINEIKKFSLKREISSLLKSKTASDKSDNRITELNTALKKLEKNNIKV